jgi:outer membrane lipoprotein SlyB
MLKDRAMLLGIVAVTAVATAGWVRQPQPVMTPVNSFNVPAGYVLDPAYTIDQPVAMPISATGVPVQNGIYRQVGAPVATVYPRAAQQPVSAGRRYSEPELRQRRADRSRDIDYRPETVVQERSKTKSAAIIGGSAAAGAVIGGLAGGGKGAAIGAVGGGAAGLVYDRMTHKNRVPADEISRDSYDYGQNSDARYRDKDERGEGRSTAKSAAIIGGGAAAGAGVGAAAGGGKGAAIGALGGAAAGLIYDRVTKNR